MGSANTSSIERLKMKPRGSEAYQRWYFSLPRYELLSAIRRQ